LSDPMRNVPPGIQIMLWGDAACAERGRVAAMSVSLMGAYLPSKRPSQPAFERDPETQSHSHGGHLLTSAARSCAIALSPTSSVATLAGRCPDPDCQPHCCCACRDHALSELGARVALPLRGALGVRTPPGAPAS